MILGYVFSGIRQDSGDPFSFGRNAVSHYTRLGIDTKTKTVIFSDDLNVPKGIKLFEEFKKIFNIVIAIGTNLTNDVGVIPLKIVIKMAKCNGIPVIKLSDDTGKNMGDIKMINAVKWAYNL